MFFSKVRIREVDVRGRDFKDYRFFFYVFVLGFFLWLFGGVDFSSFYLFFGWLGLFLYLCAGGGFGFFRSCFICF